MGQRGSKPIYGEKAVGLTVWMPPSMLRELKKRKKARNEMDDRERDWWTESRVAVADLAELYKMQLPINGSK